MLPWSEVIDPVADQNGFAGVVSVHRGGETEFARAYGLADREHLLAHRSGIGDYLDEEAGHDVTDYTLTVPPQDLATTGGYLAVLGGYPAKFRPGERFSYCNSG